jgi:hypothetical protein
MKPENQSCHTRDFKVECIPVEIIDKNFFERVFFPEIFLGCLLSEDNGERLFEGSLGVALEQRKSEDFEHRLISEEKTPLDELLIAISNQSHFKPCEPYSILDSRKALGQQRSQRCARVHPPFHSFPQGIHPNQFVDILAVFMKIIIASFKLDIEYDQKKTGHPDGQSKNIDKRVDFISEEVSQGDF